MSTFSLSGVLSLNPKWVEGNATASDSIQVQLPLADGYGSGEADSYWRASISIAAGATHDIDLTALPIVSFGGGGNLYLGFVKALLIRNTSAHSAVEVDAAATHAWTPLQAGTIGPASIVLLHEGAGNGRTVSSTDKVLSLVNTDEATTLAGTATGTAITGLSSTSGLYVGMTLGGTHPAETTIVAVGTTSVTTSAAVTTSGADDFEFTPPPAVLDVLVVGILD